MSMIDAAQLVIRALTPGRWKDLEALFASKGCSIPRGCWCMFYRETGKTAAPPGRTLAEDRKAKLQQPCNAGPPPGTDRVCRRQASRLAHARSAP